MLSTLHLWPIRVALRLALGWALGVGAVLPPAALAAPATSCPPPVPQPDAAALQQARQHDRGLLWTLQRDGRTSYLYGTLHVGKPEWMAPGPRVRLALAASDVLALEIDPTDPAVQKDLAGMDSGPPLAVPAALKTRLAGQLAAACLPAGALGDMQPTMQVLLLAMLDARWAGLDASYAQEQSLARGAREAGQPIVSLETVALQKKVLMPDGPADALSNIEQTLAQLESGSGRSVIARLASVWAHSDLAALEHNADWCDCERNDDERAAMRQLNDDRNPGLAERIAGLHGEGRRVFAAVGALHMTGPQSLPRLLAARGFKVERVTFDP
jgi:uncharacterized protein YbaP (TraB family)